MGFWKKLKNKFSKNEEEGQSDQQETSEQTQDNNKSEQPAPQQPETLKDPNPSKIAACDNCGGGIFSREDKKSMAGYVMHKKCFRQIKKNAKKNSPI